MIQLADRVHNHSSMLGVFSDVKMAAYMEETERFFLPMCKTAKRNFPDMEPAFENAKLMLNSQLTMLGAVLDARSQEAETPSSQ